MTKEHHCTMPLRINLHLGVFSLPLWDDIQHTSWIIANVITVMTPTKSPDQEVVHGRFSALKGEMSLPQKSHLNSELRIFRIMTKNMEKVPSPGLSAWHSFDTKFFVPVHTPELPLRSCFKDCKLCNLIKAFHKLTVF